MSELIDKVKLPKEIRDIVEKTNEPMSLDEIVAKFDPGFPFQARRVANSFEGHIFTSQPERPAFCRTSGQTR